MAPTWPMHCILIYQTSCPGGLKKVKQYTLIAILAFFLSPVWAMGASSSEKRCYNFLKPNFNRINKSVSDNCRKILAKASDDKLYGAGLLWSGNSQEKKCINKGLSIEKKVDKLRGRCARSCREAHFNCQQKNLRKLTDASKRFIKKVRKEINKEKQRLAKLKKEKEAKLKAQEALEAKKKKEAEKLVVKHEPVAKTPLTPLEKKPKEVKKLKVASIPLPLKKQEEPKLKKKKKRKKIRRKRRKGRVYGYYKRYKKPKRKKRKRYYSPPTNPFYNVGASY